MKVRLADLAIVAGTVVVFIGLASWQIGLPGLYYDEALDAQPALRLLQGRMLDFPRDGGWIELFGTRWPLMVMEYVGPLNLYASLVAFRLFGVSTEVVRGVAIITSVGALVMIWLVGVRLAGRPAAAIAVLLTAVSPSFVFWSRQGFHVTSIMSLFFYGGLLAAVAWWRSGRGTWLVLAALSMGLGVTAKVLFVWFVVAAVVAALAAGVVVAGWRPLMTSLRARLSVPGAVAAALAFLGGLAPLLIYNLQTGGTIEVLFRNAATTEQGVDNLALGANLATRLEGLRALLDSGGQFWFLGGVYSNPVMPWAFGLAALAALGISWLEPAARAWRWSVTFLLLFSALVVAQSVVTVSGLGPTHYFVLLGALQLVTACGIVLVAGWVRRRLTQGGLTAGRTTVGVATAVVLLVAVLVVREVAVDQAYHQSLARTGGLRTHSDALVEVAADFRARGFTDVVAGDWGIARNLEILSGGAIVPREIVVPGRETPPEFYALLEREAARGSGPVWLFTTGDAVIYPRFEATQAWLAARGQRLAEIDVVRQRDGTILMRYYRLLDQGAS